MKYLGIFFIIILSMLSGCSSNLDKIGQQNLYQVLRNKKQTISDYLLSNSRKGVVYDNYETLLLSHVIYKDLRYRQMYLDEMKSGYFFRSTDRGEQWIEENKEYQNFYDFIVILATAKGEIHFGTYDTEWRAYLQDTDGSIEYASLVEKLPPNSYEQLFLKKYFLPLDLWSVMYHVRFPKFNRKIAKANITFVISGVKGKIILNWKNSTMFFENNYDIVKQ